MRKLLVDCLATERVITRAVALARFPRHVIDDALARGVIASVFPGVYCLPNELQSRLVRRLAALAYQPRAALSHLDGLDAWNYPLPMGLLAKSAIHISKGPGPSVRQPGLKVHRREGFGRSPLTELRPHGLVVVQPEQAIVESWALLPEFDRRAPLIVAVRDRRMSPDRLKTALSEQPRAAGLAEMRRILGLVSSGCHSELELWGHSHVFSVPGLRHACRQHRVTVRGQSFSLDRYYEDEMVAFEMDGAAYHGSPGQRERDIRRDALVATRGILTVRFSHQRLFHDVQGVRAEALAILRMRRRQLGIA